MAPRKDGVSEAQARLARLSKEARPTSELTIGSASASPQVVNEATTDAKSSQHVTSHVAEHDTPYVTKPAFLIHEHVAEDEITARAVISASVQQREQFTTRIRGRWTADQRSFIDQLAREQNATAGELLRHIVAWFLERPQPQSLTPRATSLSGHTLMRREIGLKILDFLTTPDQAVEIKQASAGLGEAAWLRRAVDAYRNEGPLAPHTSNGFL